MPLLYRNAEFFSIGVIKTAFPTLSAENETWIELFNAIHSVHLVYNTHTHQTNEHIYIKLQIIHIHKFFYMFSAIYPWGWRFCSGRVYVNERLVILYKLCVFVGVCVYVIMVMPFWWSDINRRKSKQWGKICLRIVQFHLTISFLFTYPHGCY